MEGFICIVFEYRKMVLNQGVELVLGAGMIDKPFTCKEISVLIITPSAAHFVF